MLHFIANLSFLYTELPFIERFNAAASSGFRGVEFLFPYDYPALNLRRILNQCNLQLALFNLPAGDAARGEWGLLSDPAQMQSFRKHYLQALEYAQILDCGLLNVMFGQRIGGLTLDQQCAVALENLAWAAPLAQEAGVTLLIEPLNKLDFPAYCLSSTSQAIRLLEALNSEQVKLQLDLYHCAMNAENPVQIITNLLPCIKHIQLADAPGRHQPGSGKIPFHDIFALLERSGYPGACSLEYKPEGNAVESLGWMQAYDWM
jgi:hydroxypyruvate isomerase